MKRLFIITLFLTFFVLLMPSDLLAQGCSMCAATVETTANEGSGIGAGLNKGILYLMVFPYILMGVVAYAFYKKYKQRKLEN